MGRRLLNGLLTVLAMLAAWLGPAALARGADAPAAGAASSASAVSTRASAGASQALAWPDLLNRISAAVSSKDIRALTALLDPLPVIRAFGSDSAQPAERLLAATMNGKVLATHGYIGTPSTLAGDLTKDLKAMPEGSVPAEALQAMCLRDPAALKRANEIASNWIGQVLQPSPQQLVGVIAIWPGQASGLTDGPARHPIFILVLGDMAPRSGRCIIEAIQFGDPLDSAR